MDINLSKTAQKNYCEGPIQDATGAWGSCPIEYPCQQEAAKKPTLHPNSQSSAPTLIIIKEKMGEW
jgi:hypothetical protein